MSLQQQQQSLRWSPTHVKVVVVRARGLRAKGKNGTSDAYAIMQLGKEKYSSSVAEKSSEPVWREEAEFELPVLQQGGADKSSTLYLIVMHRALVGLDKFLGQAVINLSELAHHKTRNKEEWHKLHSKPGKKEKQRGDIEVDIRFVRNNMTASMFDLSMNDKSRSPFGKLKDKLKGKKKDGFSDSASAVVPSISAPADSDDEHVATEKKKKKSKLKMLFPKSNLQRTSLSQSMSVIPTGPSSPADVAKKTSALVDEDFTEVQLQNSPEEDTSSNTLFIPKIMSHKRASSADTKQLNLAPTVGGKKETLSLFGGLRPKSDPVSQSSLCINGSHVYTEEPNSIPHVKPKSDPKLLSNSQFYVSPEDPMPKLSPASAESSSALSSKSQTQTASSDQALKSPIVPASQSLGSTGDQPVARGSERPKEKGPVSSWSAEQEELGENAESANALAGGTKSLNPFEDDQGEEERSARPAPKGEAATKKEEPKRGGIMALFPRKTEAVKAPVAKDPQNPFDTVEIKKPPSSSVWSNRTAAVKPKLDVSPEANSLSPPSLSEPRSPSPSALSDPFSSAPAIRMKASDFSSLHLTYSPPASVLPAEPLPSSLNAKSDSLESSPSRLNELRPFPLLLSPAARSSSSSRSSDSPTSQLPAAERVEGRARQVEAPLRQGSKMSSQFLFQELTGRKLAASDGQPSCNGEGVSPSAIEQREELSRDAALETNPEGKFENTEESERANDEQQRPLQVPGSSASQGKVSTDPSVLIDLSPVPTSEANLPMQPPKVFPRNVLSSLVESLSPKPSFSQGQKVLPTPAPRNLTKMSGAVSSDASLQSAEGQPLEDLISLQWKAECSTEPVKGPAVVRGADIVALGNSDADQQGDDYRGILVAALDPEPSTTTSEEITDVTAAKEMDVIEECPSSLWPSGQLVIPGKVEDGFAKERAVEVGSRFPSREPGTPPWKGDTGTLFDPEPDPTQVTVADSDHPRSVQLMRIEPGHQEWAQGEKSVDDVTVTQGEGEPYGRSPADDGESAEISKETNFGDPEPITKVPEQELAHGTSDLSAGPFGECEQQTSESSAVGSSSSNQLPESGGQAETSPPPPDPLGFSAPSLSLSALSQPAFPAPDDPPMTKPSARSCHGAEHSGQKKPLQARVLPTETQPIHSQDNVSGRRPHPVKPMSATETRFKEMSSQENLKSKMKNINVLLTKSVGNSLATNESQTLKEHDPSNPAAAYAQLTHDELVQLVLKQKETIAKKEGHTRELENYIDNLLVRVMEETPNLLRVAYRPNQRAERV